ncbi:MAG: 4-hydroxy-tetrahydrodipicolinate synthase [Bacteroidetes bacterium]|nr:4-hydroxy-tetrahydrodipicolinate synthase [Bacteroidota bacterium]MBU1373708.1 4-hydroxy-tetrahydrodipicolinate synthase [Bacteroidota bacterium]MBU1485192.1 4-hydroxy-tetrahydrodipicolinate synthase [Bacteroidota bacterium]MBU1761663.1 4-hydroxy-tetrahydrodipicolinate synthase [Bacteroidota bacterium]MBU2046359.1 4-hydroxy-tetrahydrodipicolinate synthase [Bacteroidota bacterium]
MSRFTGTGVAMVTPFLADGSVDFNALEKTIEHLINGKVEYIVVMGTTAESATLTKEEKQKIFEFTAQKTNKRIPLVAGIGSNNTAEVVEAVTHFDLDGYEAILSVVPYYNKPTQEGIYQHYRAIADASKLPIILYNVPGRTGVTMSAATTLRLADHKNIIATKEASGNFDIFNEIAANKPLGFNLISGDDPVTLPMIALGAIGVISVIGNALPFQTSEIVRNCLKGDFKAAQPQHSSLLEFTRLCFVEGNPAGVKAGMKELSICDDHVRLPLVKVSDETRAKIVIEIKKLS